MRSALFRSGLIALLATSACDSASDAVRVTAYSGTPLTADDAILIDGFGFVRDWEGERDGDRVVLSRTGLCGDECSETTELTFRDRGGALPEFEGAELVRQELLPERYDRRRLRVERVEVQDWDVEGVVSGRVRGERDLVFWYDFSDDG